MSVKAMITVYIFSRGEKWGARFFVVTAENVCANTENEVLKGVERNEKSALKK